MSASSNLNTELVKQTDETIVARILMDMEKDVLTSPNKREREVVVIDDNDNSPEAKKARREEANNEIDDTCPYCLERFGVTNATSVVKFTCVSPDAPWDEVVNGTHPPPKIVEFNDDEHKSLHKSCLKCFEKIHSVAAATVLDKNTNLCGIPKCPQCRMEIRYVTLHMVGPCKDARPIKVSIHIFRKFRVMQYRGLVNVAKNRLSALETSTETVETYELNKAKQVLSDITTALNRVTLRALKAHIQIPDIQPLQNTNAPVIAMRLSQPCVNDQPIVQQPIANAQQQPKPIANAPVTAQRPVVARATLSMAHPQIIIRHPTAPQATLIALQPQITVNRLIPPTIEQRITIPVLNQEIADGPHNNNRYGPNKLLDLHIRSCKVQMPNGLEVNGFTAFRRLTSETFFYTCYSLIWMDINALTSNGKKTDTMNNYSIRMGMLVTPATKLTYYTS